MLTIKLLEGTYKPVVDEQELANLLREIQEQGSDEATSKAFEMNVRQSFEQSRVTISADGTFEFQEFNVKVHGQVKRDESKFILITDSGDLDAFTLDVSADGKRLLFHNPENPSDLVREYVKQ